MTKYIYTIELDELINENAINDIIVYTNGNTYHKAKIVNNNDKIIYKIVLSFDLMINRNFKQKINTYDNQINIYKQISIDLDNNYIDDIFLNEIINELNNKEILFNKVIKIELNNNRITVNGLFNLMNFLLKFQNLQEIQIENNYVSLNEFKEIINNYPQFNYLCDKFIF
jgi:hypothetical protein